MISSTKSQRKTCSPHYEENIITSSSNANKKNGVFLISRKTLCRINWDDVSLIRG